MPEGKKRLNERERHEVRDMYKRMKTELEKVKARYLSINEMAEEYRVPVHVIEQAIYGRRKSDRPK